MGVAYYIVLDNEEPGFDTFVNGKFLADDAENLDSICEGLGIPVFSGYVAMSADDVADMFGDDVELPEGGGEQWFDAGEGISLVNALIVHVKANPGDVGNPEGVLKDLAEYAEVFQKADKIGAKWHLNLDM